MIEFPPIPWHTPLLVQLNQQRLADKLASGIIIESRSRLETLIFCKRLAEVLLCENPANGTACGQCRSCGWLTGGAHPDFQWVTLADKKQQISVEQVRALNARTVQTTQTGLRINVLVPADAMNLAAANALLKTLEEPPAGNVFILGITRSDRLPATISSRCIRFVLPNAEPDQVNAFVNNLPHAVNDVALDVAGGNIIEAANLDKDRLENWLAVLDWLTRLRSQGFTPEMPKSVAQTTLQQWLDWMQSLGVTLLRAQNALPASRFHSDEGRQFIEKFAAQIDQKRLFQWHDAIVTQRRALEYGASMNADMLLDNLLSQWSTL